MRIIRGKFGRRRFDVPSNITARPTTDFARENIFNVIENLIDIDSINALDLFAGTGAITFELLSRGARSVTSVERSPIQSRFIDRVAQQLGVDQSLRLIRGDAFRYLRTAPASAYDFVFADPPYDMPDFELVPELVLSRGIVRTGGIFIIEHSAKRNFTSLPHFLQQRAYGSVNFSIFQIPETETEATL